MIFRRPSPPPPLPPRPRPGAGTLLTLHGGQFVYSAAAAGLSWLHPWRVSLSGGVVRIGDGRVNTLMPKIAGERMVDTALDLRADPAEPVGVETWVCVEVTPVQATKDGPYIVDPDSLVIRHRSEPTTQTATTGRQPLALIVWAGRTPQVVIQHTFFNLKYSRIERDGRIDHDFR